MRPPHQGRLGKGDLEASVQLVCKCFGFSSMKGEGLMVHTGTDPAPKYFRLRASVPGRLWRWRDISGWRWKHPGDHINLLELIRAIFTSIKWRISRSNRCSVRFLHLTDSMVCMHALTRGQSSSKKLRPVIMRLNALMLAGPSPPLGVYSHITEPS